MNLIRVIPFVSEHGNEPREEVLCVHPILLLCLNQQFTKITPSFFKILKV